MEWPMKHDHPWGMVHEAKRGWDDVAALYVPAPMAFIGMIVAFMFGCTLGLMVAKKEGAMAGKQWGKYGMGHHHHGWGESPCFESHGGSKKRDEWKRYKEWKKEHGGYGHEGEEPEQH